MGAGASSGDLQRDGEQQRHAATDVPGESKKNINSRIEKQVFAGQAAPIEPMLAHVHRVNGPCHRHNVLPLPIPCFLHGHDGVASRVHGHLVLRVAPYNCGWNRDDRDTAVINTHTW